MNTVMTVKKGVVLAMALSAMMLSSAHALTFTPPDPARWRKARPAVLNNRPG